MSYENIFKLQQIGYNFQDAQTLDNKGIEAGNLEALEEWEEEQRDLAEDLEYRQSCGILTAAEEASDRQADFDDMIGRFYNEY